jgi:hypothetical protein
LRRSLARIQIGSALLIWAAAFFGAVQGVGLFADYLYFFAWYPLIVCLDGLLFLARGESWLWDRPRHLLRMAVWSVTIWLVFELFNLYLQNWRYTGIEPRLFVRWPGYALAFATVLPGILLTAKVLSAWGLFANLRGRSRSFPAWPPVFMLLGVACLVLPLIWPRYCFPLIWLGFFLLLDPGCDLLAGDSLTRRWLEGARQEHLCLLLAGLLCGLWWELWNFPGTSRWIYTIPMFDFGKVFEMPILGYLGFPSFALEAAVMYNFLVIVHQRLLSPRRRLLAGLLQAAFWLAMFWAIDAWTVISFR